jgi:hypothetical protein
VHGGDRIDLEGLGFSSDALKDPVISNPALSLPILEFCKGVSMLEDGGLGRASIGVRRVSSGASSRFRLMRIVCGARNCDMVEEYVGGIREEYEYVGRMGGVWRKSAVGKHDR